MTSLCLLVMLLLFPLSFLSFSSHVPSLTVISSMWRSLLLFVYITYTVATENYAIHGEEACFSLGFETLIHDEAFQDASLLSFLTSFYSSVSLELSQNSHDAFKGYLSLSPPPSKPLLDEVKKVLYRGCECMMASSGKRKKDKGKKSQKSTTVDETCKVPYAFYFLADLYKKIQKPDEALDLFIAASKIHPSLGEAHTQAGVILMEKGEALQSLPFFQRATEIYPKKYFTHYYCGLALTNLNKIDEAAEYFEKATSVCTSTKDKFNVLIAFSANLHKAGRKHWQQAEEVYQRTLAAAKADSPLSYAQALSHYGAFLKDLEQYDKSIDHLSQAVAGDPSECGFRLNLGHAYEARHSPGDTERALGQYESDACASQLRAICEAFIVRQKLCAWGRIPNWTSYIDTVSHAVRTTEPLCVTPAMSLFSELSEPIVELVISRNFALKAESNVKSKFKHSPGEVGEGVVQLLQQIHSRAKLESHNIDKNGRIKIGYVSAYFFDHIVGYILETMLKLHDSSKYEIFIYALNPPNEKDRTRKKIAAQVEHFIDVSRLHYSEVAEKIKEDNLLVLVNMDGHMPGFPQEILAYMPAPVQVAFLGFPGSSGSNYTHYIVADGMIIPPEQEYLQLYTEKVIYMPHSYLPTQQATIHKSLTMKSASERNGKFTFCSLNQLIKLDPTTMRLWQRILHRVPNSQLWLQKHPPDAVPYLQEFSPSASIVFLDRNSSVMEYMNQMKKCDLFLDPLKYNSHTTGADSLWMGVPLLTMPGTRFASRVGASLIHALTRPDLAAILVTDDVGDYEDTAVSLATNVTLWTHVQETLVSCVRSSPLFDLQKWVEYWEWGLSEAGYQYVVAKKKKIDNIFVAEHEKE